MTRANIAAMITAKPVIFLGDFTIFTVPLRNLEIEVLEISGKPRITQSGEAATEDI
jgi:hypothetical protein